tara:strand:+ start:395 stop:745 length:351 start_codon:yes stop_codon:yes gene_type:complete
LALFFLHSAAGTCGIILNGTKHRLWSGAAPAGAQHEWRFFIAYAAVIIVGVGSMAFHMTLLRPMQMLDEVPMLYSAQASSKGTAGWSWRFTPSQRRALSQRRERCIAPWTGAQPPA